MCGAKEDWALLMLGDDAVGAISRHVRTGSRHEDEDAALCRHRARRLTRRPNNPTPPSRSDNALILALSLTHPHVTLMTMRVLYCAEHDITH